MKAENDTKRHTKKRAMIQALEKSLGIVTSACNEIGIERKTHYRWLTEDESYRNRVADIENIAIDFAESKLYGNIKNGDVASTIFFLKTKGKQRGYTEKQEIDMNANLKGSISIDEWIKDRIK
jgi:hypothetical protein